MENITLGSGKTVIFHSVIRNAALEKALEVIDKHQNKEIHARSLKIMSKGLSVLDVSRNMRVVIDGDSYHCMTHEKYNNFISKR